MSLPFSSWLSAAREVQSRSLWVLLQFVPGKIAHLYGRQSIAETCLRFSAPCAVDKRFTGAAPAIFQSSSFSPMRCIPATTARCLWKYRDRT